MRLVDAHLDDQQLVARYYDSSGTEPSIEVHLLRCPVCAARRDELAAALDDDHDQLLRTSDGLFAEPRLVAQRTSILERIARPRVARILAFEPPSPTTPAVLRAVRHSRRWMAAAAVLFMSVGVGSSWWLEVRRSSPGSTATFAAATIGSAAGMVEVDDLLLSEVDLALARPQTAELRALDALTPRAGDFDGAETPVAR